jgi:uncharacterized protein (TIGR02186 family)
MNKLFASLALLLCLSAPAQALPIIADISSHEITIHTSFSGTRLMVFGARNDPGDIVIVVRGPEKNITVRRKERVAGMWINRQQEVFEQQPLFYRIASSRALSEVRQFRLFEPLDILLPLADETPQSSPFLHALRQQLSEDRLYGAEVSEVEFMGTTLFKAEFDFPDNMPRGTYTAEAYLFTDGRLSGMQAIPVEVYKIGTDAALYEAAQNHGFFYGLFSIFLAVSFGIGANKLFQRF